MNEPVPSKKQTLQYCPFCGGQPRWCADDEHECHRIVCGSCKISIDFDENPDVETVEELRAIMADKWNRRALEIERLRSALRGIQSCSTCEACRGAATLALGGAAPEPAGDLASAARNLLALVQNKGQPMSHPDNRKLTDAGDVILVSEARLWMLQLALSKPTASAPPSLEVVRAFYDTIGRPNELLEALKPDSTQPPGDGQR